MSLRERVTTTGRLWAPRFASPTERSPGGAIDYPHFRTKLRRGPLIVNGWALFPDEAVSHLEVWLDEEPLGRARLGIPRPDVTLSRGHPNAAISGFELATDLTQWDGPDGPATVRAVATSVTGRTYELERVTLEIRGRGEKKSDEKRIEPPAARTPRGGGGNRPHVMVCTHQLNLGGAQLYLLDLLRELIKSEAIEATVVSGLDGSLRQDIEELGIPVHISSLVPVDDLSSHIGRVEELTAWAADRQFDAAFVNTATALALPGAEVASQLGIPAMWAIHESFAPAVLWSGMSAEIRERAEATLAEAALVVFEAEATQRLYEPPLEPSQCVTLPYGLDLGPIEAEREEFDMASARRKASVPADADVLLCVGTVEARKAQIPLAQAFDLIAGDHPDAHLVIVGGGKNQDSVALREWIEKADWGDRLRLIPVTPDVHSWYALADLLVCASDIESLPRTVLEAMVFETPVLATEVFGIPELIEDGKTGWLCEPRDVTALAEALDRFLKTPDDVRRRVAQASCALVEERHYLPEYANQISKQLGGIVEGHPPESQRRIAAR
jgi:D-inositol-3-phosphate glycosyltransferase